MGRGGEEGNTNLCVHTKVILLFPSPTHMCTHIHTRKEREGEKRKKEARFFILSCLTIEMLCTAHTYCC